MGGGGGATASNEITFADTSEFIYRNSSEKSGGGTVEIGTVNEGRDRGTTIAEDVIDTAEALDQACRTQIKGMVTELEKSVTAAEQETTDVQDYAQQVFDSALTLYDDVDTTVNARLDDLRQETIDRICSHELQWQRTAGSSLNCLVLGMKNKALTEMARRMSAVAAEVLFEARDREQQAIQRAFEAQLSARTQPRQLAFSQIGQLLAVLKGSLVNTTRDRDVNEQMNEDVNQLRAMGNLFYSAKTVSANEGTHAGAADDYAAAAQAVAPTA